MYQAGAFGHASLVGVVKEVAPGPSAKTDAELGVEVLQRDYFPPPLFLDNKRTMIEHLGDKVGVGAVMGMLLSLASAISRTRAKKVEGNQVGDYKYKGGVLMVKKGGQRAEFVMEGRLGVPYDWAAVQDKWKSIVA
uniref:Uncharacterized protein n=1 Tax=Hemiselmis tepida TaxID=464990 RepID=A0A7S0YXM3_9CRYP|mmetsp:Transcript_29995/g.75947  ORF Transcript_29995/g.75947 Transcript_29995/m.75947 type:complete len:136 (+) Transcript_29995:266-673(+)|eukprot:CAMPEP_0174932472 /NCGR_PEP_ID=MMETSP1355-20121228/35720_1 /TAXON_ID=464990 /ORGANISM="Hemiselmis tepida, Strain CCMP443" /LENGTH=135 /DNA_ID=CAMNT_0016178887 /DNA_START=266 /DNA_END=673 /DNA_ORIENTATION=-